MLLFWCNKIEQEHLNYHCHDLAWNWKNKVSSYWSRARIVNAAVHETPQFCTIQAMKVGSQLLGRNLVLPVPPIPKSCEFYRRDQVQIWLKNVTIFVGRDWTQYPLYIQDLPIDGDNGKSRVWWTDRKRGVLKWGLLKTLNWSVYWKNFVVNDDNAVIQ